MCLGRGIPRGISTVVISFLLSIAILSVFTYILTNITASMHSASLGFRNIVRYSQLHEVVQIIVNRSMDRVYLLNIGSSDAVIDQVVVVNPVNQMESRKIFELCNSSIIPAYRTIACDPGYEYVAAITRDGAIIHFQTPIRRAYPLKVNSTYIIPITFTIKSPEELKQEFDVDYKLVAKPYTRERASVGFRGVKSDKLLLLPPGQESEFFNASVSTESGGLRFGAAIIGYDPSWVRAKAANPNINIPPRFTVMISGPGFSGVEKIRIGGRTYTLSGNGFRILINNFSGVIQIKQGDRAVACSSSIPNQCGNIPLQAIGTWYYGSTDDSGLNLRIHLSGSASYIAKFMRMASGDSPTGETSYYPYLFIGDIDGNGVNDAILTTEDALYGSTDRDRTNDRYGNDDLSDYSTTPLVLKLLQIGSALGSPDGSIDGKRFAGVALYINIIFHDNSHPDEDQLRDVDRTDWVLRILLIDGSGAEYIVREYRYQEICNYHKTRVTDFGRDNYFVKISQSIYVPIPSEDRYWIAIAFQDPYWREYRNNAYINDADITVGVEFIAAVPFTR